MAENVGGIYYEVDADTSGLLRAEREVDQSTRKMERGLKDSTKATDAQGEAMKRLNPITKGVKQETDRLSGSLTGMSKAAKLAASALAMVGISVGLREALTQVMDFQDAMNGLAAVSGATAEQMAELESQARSLGATSQFSATQAGEAQRFLAQAGFEVNEILGATPGILQLATAGSLDLASAADIASNVLGGMRMEVDELNLVNDVLAATAARSNTSIEQLGQALSYAAPFAAGAGVSIEELSAAIGVMSDAGIQASRAGTGMVGVIRQLSLITNTGQAVLERYGLSMADVSIEARGLGPVLETLREANLDTAAAIELFGSEAGAAAQVLVSDYKGAIEGAAGEAERMAKQLDQGLGPAFKSLQSAISESVLQMGDSGLAGALEDLIRTTTGVVSVFNGMGDEWADANDASNTLKLTVDSLAIAIQTMAAIAAGRAVQALGAYTAAKLAANGATLTFTGSIVALRTAMMGLMGPAGLIFGGITALGALGRAFDDTSQRMANMEGRANELAASLQHMGETSIRTQLAAVTLELANMDGAQQALEEQSRRSSRTNSVLGADFRNLSESIQTTVVAARHSREEHDKLRTQQLALKNALDLIADSGREAGEAVSEISLPGMGGEDGDDSAAKRQEEERERLREHLARRLEMIRESLMNEQELEVEHHANRMDELAEIREQEMLTRSEEHTSEL